MIIPKYENTVAPQSGGISISTQVAKPSMSAFTADAQAGQQVAQGISKAAGIMAAHAEEKRKLKDASDLATRKTQFSQEMQNILHDDSDETIENGDGSTTTRKKGILNRELWQSEGATVDYDNVVNKKVQQYLSGLSKEQQQTLMPELMSHATSIRSTVIQHEAQQGQKDIVNNLSANLKQQAADAVMSVDGNDFAKRIDDAAKTQEKINAAMYIKPGSEAWDMTVNDAKSLVATSTVKALIDSDPAKANALYASVKDRLTPLAQAELGTVLANKTFEIQQNGVWEDVQGYKLSNGYPDVTKMMAHIEGIDGYTIDQKNKLRGFVRGRAEQEESGIKDMIANADKAKVTNILKAKKSGQDFSKILKMAGGDPMLEGFAEKIMGVSPDVASDGAVEAHEMIINGNLTSRDSLYKMMIDKKIKPDDFPGLLADMHRVVNGGVNKAETVLWDSIKSKASGSVPKEKMADFLYTVKDAVAGKPHAEAMKIVDEYLKGVPKSGSWFFDVGQKKVWEKKSLETEKIKEFKNSDPRYAKAIQFLKSRGALVTNANVEAVVNKFPDGNIPEDTSITRKQ
jgi:hypothetical protein